MLLKPEEHHLEHLLRARGSSLCVVLSPGEETVHLQSILTPPNNEVITKAVEYLSFHLCLIRAASASNVLWNGSKALLLNSPSLLLNLWVN